MRVRGRKCGVSLEMRANRRNTPDCQRRRRHATRGRKFRRILAHPPVGRLAYEVGVGDMRAYSSMRQTSSRRTLGDRPSRMVKAVSRPASLSAHSAPRRPERPPQQPHAPAGHDAKASSRVRHLGSRKSFDHYLGQDRPLGEARLLFEISASPGGVSLRELRSRLGLDAGYLSRMVKALETQGMIRTGVHPDDNRLRTVELNLAGGVETKERNRPGQHVRRGRAGRPERTPAAAAHRGHGHRPAPAAAGRHHDRTRRRPCPGRSGLPGLVRRRHRRPLPRGLRQGRLVHPDEVSGDAGAFLVAYEEGRPVGRGALRRLEPGVGARLPDPGPGDVPVVRLHGDSPVPRGVRGLLLREAARTVAAGTQHPPPRQKESAAVSRTSLCSGYASAGPVVRTPYSWVSSAWMTR